MDIGLLKTSPTRSPSAWRKLSYPDHNVAQSLVRRLSIGSKVRNLTRRRLFFLPTRLPKLHFAFNMAAEYRELFKFEAPFDGRHASFAPGRPPPFILSPHSMLHFHRPLEIASTLVLRSRVPGKMPSQTCASGLN
ncbi:hypothetical protein CDAR_306551 [Caerostris darwini]|uniref:Uncharacterized protein n=1 Tax=Caerostris darwini TaxID=1538125 RepID=A0AAV4MX50_9ARAC|nr:hypothetical protein CDAR_306551 [Caerostris darwini]